MCLSKLLGLFQKPEPQPLYPNDLPPILSQQKVIEELEFDILIHERYAVAVVQEPNQYPPAIHGDYDWHMRWIEVYQAAIYYIERADSGMPEYDRLSCYSRRMDI